MLRTAAPARGVLDDQQVAGDRARAGRRRPARRAVSRRASTVMISERHQQAGDLRDLLHRAIPTRAAALALARARHVSVAVRRWPLARPWARRFSRAGRGARRQSAVVRGPRGQLRPPACSDPSSGRVLYTQALQRRGRRGSWPRSPAPKARRRPQQPARTWTPRRQHSRARGPSPVARPSAAGRSSAIPMSMTDYDGAMDVMDDMIERRERGWICAAAVHSLMVAQDDPTMRTALTQSDHHGARRDADRVGGQPARRAAAQPRLRARADAAATARAPPSRATGSGSTGAATRARSSSWRSTCARSIRASRSSAATRPRSARSPRTRTMRSCAASRTRART